jgi:hypothetical protein
LTHRDRGTLADPPADGVDISNTPPSTRTGHTRIPSVWNVSPRASLIAASVTAVVLVGLVARNLFGGEAVHAASSRAPMPQNTAAPARAAQDPAQPVTLKVTSEEFKGDAANPCAACGLPAAIDSESRPWKQWVSLGGTRLAASSTETILPLYAARTPYGVAVLVVNHGEAKTSYNLDLKLGRGVYTAERMVFDPQTPEVDGRFERLESLVLGKTSGVEKPGWLASGHAALYKFTNRCLDVQASFDNVRHAVRAMQSTSPSGCRTVMVPLNECEGHLGSLSKGIRPERRYDSLRYIHRALLTVNHAQALAQNFKGQGRLPREGADRLGAALDHLQAALTDLSAGCLNLLPSLSVAPPDEAKPGMRSVTVQLANAGQQSVSLVRLGADAAPGSTVSPAERAIFDVLRPGETARATFTVQLPEEAAANDLSAEFAWFAAKTPARLRLKFSY